MVTEPMQVYSISILSAFGFMAVPAASSHLSRRTAPQEQGVGQGALSGFKSLAQYVVFH
jgi:hypothetical protein